MDIFTVNQFSKKIKLIQNLVSFSDNDLGVELSNQDPLVITTNINEYSIHKILIDTRASRDILYWNTFRNMNLDEKDLKISDTTPVKGFGQVKIPVAGNITLQVTLGEGSYSTTKEVTFTIVRFTSAYNGIFGRSSLHEFEIVTSSFHQYIKF